MSMRAAMLTNDAGPAHAAMLTALTQGGALAEVRTVHLGGRMPVGAALRLLAYRPDLVIAEAGLRGGLVAALYRVLARRSRLLVRTTGAAPSCIRSRGQTRAWARALLLSRADAVLADAEFASPATRPVFTMAAPSGLDPFLARPLPRSPAQAHRLVYDGPLSPQSGVADILLCLGAWAEQNPACPTEIWWIGEGDLAGVLEAQPLPPSLSQRFLGPLDTDAAAQAYADCGIMVLPGRMAPSPASRAAAAGLVLVGPARPGSTRHGNDALGWTFDPARPDTMMHAIADALGSDAEDLDARRAAGRDRVLRAIQQGPADRLRHALAAVMPSMPAAAAATSAATAQAAPARR